MQKLHHSVLVDPFGGLAEQIADDAEAGRERGRKGREEREGGRKGEMGC